MLKCSKNTLSNMPKNNLLIGNEKSARSFADRSFFMDVRGGCPFRNGCFSRIWRVWPKFLAGCPAQTSSLGWIFVPDLRLFLVAEVACSLVRLFLKTSLQRFWSFPRFPWAHPHPGHSCTCVQGPPVALPKGPCHTKNTTVIVIHYGGSKTLRR